jgi:hypothetical protein
MTYRQAVNWADDVKDYTQSHKMPPWKPTEGHAMVGERKLTDAEIDVRGGREVGRPLRLRAGSGPGAADLNCWPAGQKLFDQHREGLELLALHPQAGGPALALDDDSEGALARLADRVGLQPGDRPELMLARRQILPALPSRSRPVPSLSAEFPRRRRPAAASLWTA